MSNGCPDDLLRQELRRHFGHNAFREGQDTAVRTILDGRDLVLVMPTGSGKSLCYQLTALMLPGVTLVVSPLIALMKDQVDALDRKGIAATFLNSSVDNAEMAYRLDGLRQGRYKLVYVAPERFRNKRFTDALTSVQVSLFTVDEAHCVSQWGHDFRPDYLNLKAVLQRLGDVRVLAVTATATPDVREDIITQLGLALPPRQWPIVAVTGFARPNLYLSITRCPSHRQKLDRLLQMVEAYRCGIVYCSTRKMVERVAEHLKKDGCSPLIYHGAMADGDRSAAQDAFMSAKEPIVVATNAFGMGVDRADIRFVAHWDIPGSLEAYYQEVGRAGRDGASAWCELLYNYADVATQRFFLNGANPEFSDILAVWEAVREACAEEDVTCAVDVWTKRAKLKNDMAVRTILGMIERAHLITREIMPGNRAYTTRLVPNAKEGLAELRRLAAGLDAKRLRDERKLETLLRYVDHPGCRHAFLCNYFGESMASPVCTNCDCCCRRTPARLCELDEAQWIVIQKILSCVTRMQGRFGGVRVAQVLHGDQAEALIKNGLDKLSTFGLLAELSVPQIRAVMEALMVADCLVITADTYRLISITKYGREVMLRRVANFQMAWPMPTRPTASKQKTSLLDETGARGKQTTGVAGRLQNWVVHTAATRKIEPYRILNRATVLAIVAAKPHTFDELEKVKGMGPVKVQRFGRQILDVLEATGE